VHRIGVPIRCPTDLKGTIAEEIVASAEYLFSTPDRLLACGGEGAQDERGQVPELSRIDRKRRRPGGEMLSECEVCGAKVVTFERLADR